MLFTKKIPSKSYNKKINIVYVSGDFRSHAMMYLMKDIFKFHDKSKFNIFAFQIINSKIILLMKLSLTLKNFIIFTH